MKYKFILTLVFTTFFALACKPPKAERPATLAVTIDPQKYFLDEIVGHHFDVVSIVAAGGNPESTDFTPGQMRHLSRSKAYFKVGYLGIEHGLIEKALENNNSLLVVDSSEGIDIIGGDENCSHHHGDEHLHGHMAGDPHTWSSVTSAKLMATNMYNAVTKLDSLNKADYTKGYNKLLAEFNRTDSIIRSYLDKAPSKAFIIYHPALSYFAKDYGLTQYAMEEDGKSPSPSQLKALIDKAKEEGVKVVFIQREFDTKNAETIANAIGGKAIPINLTTYHWSKEMIKIAKALATESL
ncbi:metal ABC transporter solute-binding protein, Zn/Mn family [Dysgonomonas sp. 511]|uniref:metal ABC transporter solute-binding protein, Zn/Mn family n=1 Tax=Dysgonomonas sp. 511 TaxID=2302930 RepID=UPI0013D43E92|nr:zinc ABC transporter substrate-binding protein [Dysgonomonas sp. 511]NDV78508.1 hypothetical protein [Dysgonomonas sp. 511]